MPPVTLDVEMGLVAQEENQAALIIAHVEELVLPSLQRLRITLVELDHRPYQVVGTWNLEKVESIRANLADFPSLGLLDQVVGQARRN